MSKQMVNTTKLKTLLTINDFHCPLRGKTVIKKILFAAAIVLTICSTM